MNWEAGMEFLGHRRATHYMATFKHGDLQAGLRQVGRTDQAVVACAHQQHIAIVLPVRHRPVPESGSSRRAIISRNAPLLIMWRSAPGA